MGLKEMSQDELELLTYTDLAEMILLESNKSLNTPGIFKEICSLLGLSDSDYTSKIGDFYTSLTTDKRFLLLEGAEWDLKDRHVIDIVVEDDEDDESEMEDEEEEIEEDETSEEDVEENYDDEDTLDDDDDDLDDLVVMTEEELGAEE